MTDYWAPRKPEVHTIAFCTRCHNIPAYTGFDGMCVECWSLSDLERVQS